MKVYVETYGCRMNICDSEVLVSILEASGYEYTPLLAEANVVVLNCCSVREVGHAKTYQRIGELDSCLRDDVVLCIAGCMSTQLQNDLFDTYPRVNIIIEPTAYRLLPQALASIGSDHLYVRNGQQSEVYDDVLPTRVLEDSVTAAVTIMKGCDQYCSYCIEPYTRGERTNRSYEAIMDEIAEVRHAGYREITLFGHIVDLWEGDKQGARIGFAQLLDDVAKACPEQRVKYISSHPLTYTDEIVQAVKANDNIMRVVHLPVQSGSDKVLRNMNRRYTAQQFLQRVSDIRNEIPDMQIITDIMVGFPGEDDDNFQQTLNLLRLLQCANANVFAFSMRKGTAAYKHFDDNVSEAIKKERTEMARSLVGQIRSVEQQKLIGTTQIVILESEGNDFWYGRDLYHRTIAVLPTQEMTIGQELSVKVSDLKGQQLIGIAL